MKLKWKKYSSYEKAKDCKNCIYVFKIGNKFLYIGKAKQFGGGKGRYAYGYRYLVKMLLKSGCKLHIAVLSKRTEKDINNIERCLIKKCSKQLLNKRCYEPKREIKGLELPT